MIATTATLNILLVEDDAADQKLVRSMLEKQGAGHTLQTASSAEEAFELLSHEDAPKAEPPQTDLIILDLNMPGMGGREFLRLLKKSKPLRQIPVVILTSSTSEMDILDSYRLQAAGFVSKPAGLADFERVINGITEYWLTLCRLPYKEN